MAIDPYLVNRAANEFPQVSHPVLTDRQTPHPVFPGLTTGTRPGLRARSAAHAALKAAEQHLSNMTGARNYQNAEVASDILPELRSEVAARLTERTRGQFEDPLAGFIKVAETAHQEADAAAEKYRPKLNPESATQLVRTDQAWNNHVLPMLNSGKTWDEIIPTLDVDGILAAQRFAGGYESNKRDRFHQHEVPSVLDGIQAMTARRVVDIAPPEAREALREAQDTATTLDYTRNVARIVNETDPRNAAAISIGLTRGAYQAGVQRPVETSNEALEAYAASLAAPPQA
ncbi:hypothetical protein GCM10010458_36550 [Microbacterium luteolum]|uniref:Uncharacterized protein n=1 Tax=Microbacterium luteolum TaxID=69367 RepID=A0ABY7XK95_MICLT|nr:hypothetical protein [Microbacterium luteolum]WDM42520.1 hypothetical protein KV395_04205 [Microbacterium luteolum]